MKRTVSAVSLALGGLIALAAGMGIGRFVFTPILPFMIADGTLDATTGGYVASANFVGYVAGALMAALLPLPGSKRLWFLGALAASAATTMLMAPLSSLILFSIVRFIGGASSALVLVLASTLILERLAQLGAGKFAAIHFAGVGSGIALSAIAIPLADSFGGDWRAMWVLSGLLSLAAILIVAGLVPGDQHQADPAPDAAARNDPPPVQTPADKPEGLPRLIIAYGLFGFGYVITATFISAMARQTPQLADFEPWFWLAVGLAAVPSVPLWTWFSGRTNLRTAFSIACVVEAAGVALSVIGLGPVAVLIAAALLGGTFMGITALGLIFARSIAVGDARPVLGAMTTAFGVGQMIGPALAGAVYDATGGFFLSSMIAAGALVVASLLVLTVPLPQKA